MAFNREANITITEIGDKEVRFFIPGASNLEHPQSASITIKLLLSDGNIKSISPDLLERLGDDAEGLTHRTNLLALRDYIEARIALEVLPTP